MQSLRYLPLILLSITGVQAESTPDEALSSAFSITPVHWDKNIAVVDVCGAPVSGMADILLWPETTGELLKLMDALKYEYEMRGFHSVVFSMDAAAEGVVAHKMLSALSECVTACDMLRIPLRLAIRKGEEWVEVNPTYTTQTASHLMLGEDGGLRLFSSDCELQHSAATLADMSAKLKALAEQGTVVNLFWKPAASSYARFVELVELCNSLELEYALMLEP